VNRTIIFRVDTLSNIGSGHFMRCFALAQHWGKKGGKAIFIVAYENKSVEKKITEEGFQLVSINKAYPNVRDLKITLSTINNLSLSNEWIVLDGYHFDTNYQKCLKNNGNLLFVIDDTGHLDRYVADIIFNQNINAKMINYSCRSETKLLLGSKYVLLRDEFFKFEKWERKTPKVAKNLLVFMGGSDSNNVTVKVLKSLSKLRIKGLQIKVIIGAQNKNIDEIIKVTQNSNKNFELINNVTNISKLMAWANIAISAAGSICWEMAFMGLPALLIATAEKQSKNLRILAKYGSIINIGHHSEFSNHGLLEALINLMNDKKLRQKMSERGKFLINSNGSEKVIQNIENYKKTDWINNEKENITINI